VSCIGLLRVMRPPTIARCIRSACSSRSRCSICRKTKGQADLRFGRTSVRLESGKQVIAATNEGNSYADLLGRILKVPPSLLIVDPRASLPAELVSQLRPEPPKLICGGAAYIPNKISGEEREAAELCLRFLEGYCEAHGV
jgi:hypothetical protein